MNKLYVIVLILMLLARIANSGAVGPPLRKKSDFFKEIDIYE